MSHTEALEKVIQLLEQKVRNLELDLVNERLKTSPSIVGNGIINTPYISGGSISVGPYWGVTQPGALAGIYAQTCESVGAKTNSALQQGANAIHNQINQHYANQNLGLVPEHERNRG